MAQFHGKQANIEWDIAGTPLQHAQSWSLSATVEVAERTSMQDTWKTRLAGFKDWTATVECQADDSGPEIPYTGESGLGYDPDYVGDSDNKAKLDLYLVYDSTNTNFAYIYGDAVCSGISYSVDANDVGKITYSFQGSGTLTSSGVVNTSHSY